MVPLLLTTLRGGSSANLLGDLLPIDTALSTTTPTPTSTNQGSLEHSTTNILVLLDNKQSVDTTNKILGFFLRPQGCISPSLRTVYSTKHLRTLSKHNIQRDPCHRKSHQDGHSLSNCICNQLADDTQQVHSLLQNGNPTTHLPPGRCIHLYRRVKCSHTMASKIKESVYCQEMRDFIFESANGTMIPFTTLLTGPLAALLGTR